MSIIVLYVNFNGAYAYQLFSILMA